MGTPRWIGVAGGAGPNLGEHHPRSRAERSDLQSMLHVSADRPDFQFGVNEMGREMAAPAKSSVARVKRFARDPAHGRKRSAVMRATSAWAVARAPASQRARGLVDLQGVVIKQRSAA